MVCRSTLAAALSVFCGLLVFFLFGVYAREEGGAPGAEESCAVLVVDEAQNDRHIQEFLVRGGMEGFFSESTQKVPIDDFGALKMVALDSFREEIEAFDPRNTGFAEKLKSFFVRDGKRFFFLPMENTFENSPAKLKKRLAPLFGDIPFTLTVLRQGSPFFLYFTLLALVCGAALCLCRARRLFIYQIPVLLAFGRGGFSAFVLAALLAGIWELLREPAAELSAASRHERRASDYAGTGFGGIRERLRPFRLNCVLSLLLAGIFALFSFIWKLPPIPPAAGCLCFFFLYFLSFRLHVGQTGKSRHTPFIPVPLLPFRTKTFSLYPFLLPFGAGAALVLFLPLLFPGFSGDWEGDFSAPAESFVSAADYKHHLAFQRSFSYTPLGNAAASASAAGGGALNREGYLRYYLGEDGLIAGADAAGYGKAEYARGDGFGDEAETAAFPPFPLEKLMDFLLKYSEAAGGTGGRVSPPGAEIMGVSFLTLKEWISVILIAGACILALLQQVMPGKAKRTSSEIFRLRRTSAEISQTRRFKAGSRGACPAAGRVAEQV